MFNQREHDKLKKNGTVIETLEEEYRLEIEALNDYRVHSTRDINLSEAVDVSIKRGLAKGIRARKNRSMRNWGTFVACILLIVFITTVRVSPTFAAAIQSIPGLGYIVELIHFDKGLQSAVKNDFLQPVGMSDEHENIGFRVDGIIVDESSLVIFYTTEDKGEHEELELSRPEVFDENGSRLVASISYESYGDSNPNNDGKNHSKITVNFSQHTVIPEVITLKVRFRERNTQKSSVPISVDSKAENSEGIHLPELPPELNSIWEVKIPIDKERFVGLKKVYEINQSVIIDNQGVTFKRVTIYPTRTMLEIEYDPTNTKKIFAFDDLRLLDEKGEEWGRIMNGVSGSKLDENHETLYFQSNYFTEPKALTLQGTIVRALEKEKSKVVLDLEQKRILEGPQNLEIDKMIKSSTGEYQLYFLLETNPAYDENRGYSIFSYEFIDSNGNVHNTSGQGTMTHSGKDEYDQTLTVNIPGNLNYKSPITFELTDYPSRIFGNINLRLK